MDFAFDEAKEFFWGTLSNAQILDPYVVVSTMLGFSRYVTQSSRNWMRENPKLKLPENYVEYPGKLDHTSALCFRIGAANDYYAHHQVLSNLSFPLLDCATYPQEKAVPGDP